MKFNYYLDAVAFCMRASIPLTTIQRTSHWGYAINMANV